MKCIIVLNMKSLRLTIQAEEAGMGKKKNSCHLKTVRHIDLIFYVNQRVSETLCANTRDMDVYLYKI